MKTLRSTIATFVIGTSLAAGVVVGLAPSAVQAAPSPIDGVKVIPVEVNNKLPGNVKLDPTGGVKIDPLDKLTPIDTKNKFPKICDYAPELCPAKLPKDPGKAPADPTTPGTTPKTPGTTPKTPGTTAKPSTNKDPKLPTATPDAPVKSTKIAFTG